MSRTEKKQRNIRGDKVVVKPEPIQEPYQDFRTPYTGNTQAVLTGVEGKNIIPTDKLLNAFIKNIKNGTHTVESKAESDKRWLALFSRDSLDFLPDGFTRQDTGECCNFTIVKDKARGGFTFKLQPLDYFNLPEWVGG